MILTTKDFNEHVLDEFDIDELLREEEDEMYITEEVDDTPPSPVELKPETNTPDGGYSDS